VHQTFHEAACQLGLVSNRDQEAEICIQNAIDLNRRASDIRFRLAQMVYYGASRESLETRFCDHLADDGDTSNSVRHKLNVLLHPFDMSSYDGLGDGQLSISSDPDSHLSLLTPEQDSVTSKIIKAVLHETHELIFLQVSAWNRENIYGQGLDQCPSISPSEMFDLRDDRHCRCSVSWWNDFSFSISPWN
jgi:hypothetical protein